MKLGTRKELFSAYGDGCYLKMKECGFDYADVSISGELDGMSEAEYEQRWLAEKALADAAGVEIPAARRNRSTPSRARGGHEAEHSDYGKAGGSLLGDSSAHAVRSER